MFGARRGSGGVLLGLVLFDRELSDIFPRDISSGSPNTYVGTETGAFAYLHRTWNNTVGRQIKRYGLDLVSPVRNLCPLFGKWRKRPPRQRTSRRFLAGRSGQCLDRAIVRNLNIAAKCFGFSTFPPEVAGGQCAQELATCSRQLTAAVSVRHERLKVGQAACNPQGQSVAQA